MGNVHMKIGSNLGEVLLEIAQTNISKGNIDKAFKTYIESFDGFTKEHVLMCLKNEAVLITDENGEGVKLIDWENKIKDNADNIFDWSTIIKNNYNELNELLEYRKFCKDNFYKGYHGDIENFSLTEMMSRYFNEDELHNIGIHNLAAKLIAGHDFAHGLLSNGSNVWSHLCANIESEEALNYEIVLYWTVEYVNNIRKIHKDFIKFVNLYNFLIEYNFIKPIYKIRDFFENILEILNSFSNPNSGYYHPMCNEYLAEYKESIIDDLLKLEIGKEYLLNKILTKDIMEGYDAGWLSPKGEFYGGDGDTSAMIHMHLAEQIMEGNGEYANEMYKDKVSILSGSNSPEYWLEKNGWIKIHHEDCYGSFIGEKDPNKRTQEYPYYYCPTEIQIKMICDYADKFYGGKFYTEANVMGRDYHPEPFSTYKVKQMDEFMLHEIFGH